MFYSLAVGKYLDNQNKTLRATIINTFQTIRILKIHPWKIEEQ